MLYLCVRFTQRINNNNFKNNIIMSIFKLFNKKQENNQAVETSLPVADRLPEITEQVENDQDIPGDMQEEKKPMTISYATGWPIDIIYGYLHKNYMEKGFDDAMIKSDLTFRDMNMNIIKNKILMVFREINLNYDVMKRDIEIRMETCNAAGLLSTVSELETTMSTINAHKEELRKLEEDFKNNENEAAIPLQSYECGFLRGIATLALGTPKKVANMPQMPGQYSNSHAVSA